MKNRTLLDETKLEIITDEELNFVSGGNCSETASDSRFLNSLNGSTRRYGKWKVWWHAKSIAREITEAWSDLYIDVDVECGVFSNEYAYEGKKISQEQARKIAMALTNHQMTRKDWDH